MVRPMRDIFKKGLCILVLETSLLIMNQIVAAQPLMQDALNNAASLQDYSSMPPFVNPSVAPLVMFVMAKDHKLWTKAYTDYVDLLGNGTIETTYTDAVSYYGYFDYNKCYTYNSGTGRFEPQAAATGANLHYCSGLWSGNFLNWGTMTRLDVVRKVLYGGHRIVDTTSSTVLARAMLLRDTHDFAKPYSGADISSLIPFNWPAVTLCNTNLTGSDTSSTIFVIYGAVPYAASNKVWQCMYQYNTSNALVQAAGNNPANATSVGTYVQYNANVLVCVTAMLESNCKQYPGSGGGVIYKPSGLLEKYGIKEDGTVQMLFGLMQGSYGANVSGGVLRSNIANVYTQEISSTTGQFLATSKIISNLENLNILGYNWSTGWYTVGGSQGSCDYGEPTILTDGMCKSWGNPIGEMLYETIRYFMGKSAPTPQFQPSSPDYGNSGMTVDTWQDPFTGCPYCSKPFAVIMSDVFPSYDSDELPGSYFYSAISTADTPSVQTLLANSNIDVLDGLGSVFIGQSGATYDHDCTPKPGGFKTIRGLCVEEPTKQGAYYTAGLAYYGHTTDLRPDLQGTQSMMTYAVVTDATIPNLQFNVPNSNGTTSTVQLVPTMHDGCPTSSYPNCTSQGQNGDNSGGELVDFLICPADADWTVEQGNGFTACYDMMWDDAEFGWDYDMDMRLRIYVQTGTGTITVKTKALMGNSGHLNYGGYFIQGVTGAGPYYDITCGSFLGTGTNRYCAPYNNPGGAVDTTNPPVNPQCTPVGNTVCVTRTFPVTNSTTGLLKDPLWLAAKYGGFTDLNGNNIPDLTREWDQDGDGYPDTYFYSQNPLQLEAKLSSALADILQRSAAGSSLSVLATSTAGEGAIYQAFFYPAVYENNNEIDWVGYIQGLFLDPYGQVREDTNQNGRLILSGANADSVITTLYDTNTFQTEVWRYAVDANGKATGIPTGPWNLNDILPIWEGGNVLSQRNTATDPRSIYTWVDSNNNGVVDAGEVIPFSAGNASTLQTYLGQASAAQATNLINWVIGNQVAGLRPRELTVNGVSNTTWRLGDIVYSSPVTVGPPTERYDLRYQDQTYSAFYTQYSNRRQMIYVGANDGMLHAFNGGFYHPGDDPTTPQIEAGWFTTAQNGVDNSKPLGREMWGFIPQELLPHLQWMAQTGYNKGTHVYYVDGSPRITDAQIFTPDGVHPGGWGTVLIGSMRMGGAVMKVDLNGNGNTTDAGENRFRSAYFMIDITNPDAAFGTEGNQLIWVFKDGDLGFTTSNPAVIRIDATHWYVTFGSGPLTFAGQRDTTLSTSKFETTESLLGQIYVVNLATGALLTKIATGDSYAFMGDPAVYDLPVNYKTDILYIGDAYYANSSSPWQGKVYRLLLDDSSTGVPTANPAKWTLSTMINPNKPVLVKPTATLNRSNQLWVYFGTGRFFSTGTTSDQTDLTAEAIYGIEDDVRSANPGCWTGSGWVLGCTNTIASTTGFSAGNLCDVTATAVSTTGTLTPSTCNDSTLTALISDMEGKFGGWVLTLSGGERVLQQSTIVGGIVATTTWTPNTDICIPSGTNNVYATYYETGTAYSNSVIGTSGTTVTRSMSLGYGVPSKINVVVSNTTTTGFAQSSTGQLVQIQGITLPFNIRAGARTFREKAF